MMPQHHLPADIERTSMKIIAGELAQRGLDIPPENAPVVKRVIHTTADFDYAQTLHFTSGAVAAGIAAMHAGATIITDTNMALAGITKPGLAKLGGQALCFMADPAVAAAAKQAGTTRAVAAMHKAAAEYPGAVLAVGNAPTALLTIAEKIENGLRPALVIGVPVGFFTAVFLSKVAGKKVRSAMETAVSLLAGIPSVVYGLVGMLVLVPAVRSIFHVPDGASLLAAIIVLAIMILPSIIKVSVTALDAVPKEYEDASLALGASPVETFFRVSVPAAKSGIAAAVVLGVGRAIGEAMAVMMVAGNVANMPGLFKSVTFLTTAVAKEMSYASGLQKQALFSIALVLFVFIMVINVLLNAVLKGGNKDEK